MNQNELYTEDYYRTFGITRTTDQEQETKELPSFRPKIINPFCVNCNRMSSKEWRNDFDGNPLCFECGEYIAKYGINRPLDFGNLAEERAKKKRQQAEEVFGTVTMIEPICINCNRTNSKEWRNDFDGNPLCLECGEYIAQYGVNRPFDCENEAEKRAKRRRLNAEELFGPASLKVIEAEFGSKIWDTGSESEPDTELSTEEEELFDKVKKEEAGFEAKGESIIPGVNIENGEHEWSQETVFAEIANNLDVESVPSKQSTATTKRKRPDPIPYKWDEIEEDEEYRTKCIICGETVERGDMWESPDVKQTGCLYFMRIFGLIKTIQTKVFNASYCEECVYVLCDITDYMEADDRPNLMNCRLSLECMMDDNFEDIKDCQENPDVFENSVCGSDSIRAYADLIKFIHDWTIPAELIWELQPPITDEALPSQSKTETEEIRTPKPEEILTTSTKEKKTPKPQINSPPTNQFKQKPASTPSPKPFIIQLHSSDDDTDDADTEDLSLL